MIAKNKSFRLILLRHGNTFNPHELSYQIGCKTDLPLTEKGLSQAEAFSSYLAIQSLVPRFIFCGSLQRQMQTAQIIHECFSQSTLEEKQVALDEINYGLWEGLTQKAIQTQWPQEYQDWQDRGLWPATIFGSTLEAHLNALKLWLQRVDALTQDKDLVVAISSGGIIRLVLQLIPDLWESIVSTRTMDEYKVNTGHYCDLEINNLLPTIHSWNNRP